MARVLTRPFDERSEKFRSNFVLDFVVSGVIGLLYTLIVGALTEAVSSTVAHSLYSSVPASLDIHEYTSVQQHMRPLELLLLAGGMWWGLNQSSKKDEITQLSSAYSELEPDSKWPVLIRVAQALALTAGYLLVLATMLLLIQPEGLGWTIVTAATGMGVTTAVLLLVRRTGERPFTTFFGRSDDPPGR